MVALGAASLSAHAVVFTDDYSVDQASIINTTAVSNVDGPSQSFGLFADSTRRLSLTNRSNTAVGDARSRIAVSDGELKFSNDVEVRSAGYVTYDFLSPADLTGSDNVTLNFLANDIAATVTVTTLDYDGNANAFSAPMIVSLAPFSVTLNGILAGVDRTRMRGIAFSFEGSMAGEDLRLDNVQAVPEPASVAALGVGVLGLLRRRRRS